ncbi:MAG: tripartite tricarboxylate transporter substrate binding protein [Spirochaetales bacterium]|nr:tripartite tricarboxylate transporter substrate binding protein [Spirochaetales bacterium]
MKTGTSTARIRVLLAFAAASLLLAGGLAAAVGQAEGGEFPSKPITYVIPFDPGGQSDVTALYQKPGLEKVLGTSVVMKYMPGAGGAVAWANLVKTAADGYTICGNNIPHIIVQPLVRDNAGYQTEELLPVYLFQTTPIGLAVLKSSPYQTLDQLVAYAKTHPGEITVGGSGTHSGHHLALLQLQYLTGVKFTYIPSTGAAPSVATFLGGHTQALFANSDDLVGHRGEITVLAIGTEEPFAALPGVRTFKDQGVSMTAGIDRGVCVPPDTPAPVIQVLEEAFDQVTRDPAFVAKMEEMGFVMQYMKSAEFARYIGATKKDMEAALRTLGEIQ